MRSGGDSTTRGDDAGLDDRRAEGWLRISVCVGGVGGEGGRLDDDMSCPAETFLSVRGGFSIILDDSYWFVLIEAVEVSFWIRLRTVSIAGNPTTPQ